MKYDVARTLVSAASRLVSTRFRLLNLWRTELVAPPISALTGECAETSLGAADTSVRATSEGMS